MPSTKPAPISDVRGGLGGRVRLEPRRVSALVPADYNPRTISAEALAGLGASIDRWGVVQPVVVNRRSAAQGWPAGSAETIVSGHQRVKALSARGVEETDVVVVDLPEAEEKALNVAANSPSIAGEFTRDVMALLAEIKTALPDLSAALRMDDLKVDLAKVLRKEREVSDDDIPEPPKDPEARTGDLWLLGAHRLICGDSTDPAVVARVLRDDEPRLLLTDPPYGVELDMEWRDRLGLNGMGGAERSYMRRGEGHTNTAISGDTRADWSDAFELVPSLNVAYVWHASAHAVEVGLGLQRIGFEIKQQIIWRKPRFTLSRQHYHWQHEPCWYARKPGSSPFLGAKDQSTIWDAASPKMLMVRGGGAEEKVDHPTQKPVILYARPIQNHLEEGDVFYEPFGGSGSGIAAAEQTGRRCVCVELDPRFIDVIVARWERLTGKKGERIRG